MRVVDRLVLLLLEPRGRRVSEDPYFVSFTLKNNSSSQAQGVRYSLLTDGPVSEYSNLAELNFERTMKWSALESEPESTHHIDDGLTRLDFGSEIGYVLLAVLLLELDLL